MVILLIAIVSFAFVYTPNTQASNNDKQTTKTVIIRVKGCDNCNNVAYCLDNYWHYVNSCNIELQLEFGASYSICIGCQNNKSCIANFTVDNSGDEIQYVDVRVVSGTSCTCDQTKKK